MTSPFNFEVVPLADAFSSQSNFSSDHRRPVVLIVDDEQLIADTLSAILSRCGFFTLTAYDGESALSMASVVPPEILISDIRMPGMSGIDLGMAIVDAVPDCKVLLFSAHASNADLHDARQAGYDFPLLVKPVRPGDMLTRISECLGIRQFTAVLQ